MIASWTQVTTTASNVNPADTGPDYENSKAALENSPVKIRIAAYNVLFGNWAQPERIGEMFKPYNLDIIGFSEVPDGDWTARVGRILGMDYVYVGKISSANHKDKFKSLLSRTPLTDTNEIEINAVGWAPASIVGATTKIKGMEVTFYSLHIPGRDKAEGSAAEFLARKIIPQLKPDRLIIMGDYNNHIGEESLNLLAQAGMKPTWDGLDIDLENKSTHKHIETGTESGIIDHIFFNSASLAQVSDGGIIYDVYNPPDEDKPMKSYYKEWKDLKKPLSDHRPIWAELVLPQRPKAFSPEQQVSVEVDWLIKPVKQPTELHIRKRSANKIDLVLTNGLISRTFCLLPNAATVAFDNLMTSESILRAVKPEATVKIDGVEYEVGGLKGQVERAYLRPEWVDDMISNPDTFQFTGYHTNKIKARLPWKQNRHAQNLSWPPPGLELVMSYKPPHSSTGLYNGLKVQVHYEMYQGIPVLSKRITVVNETDKIITLDRFVSEILATVDFEVPEELMSPDPWHPTP
ncbi:MAG: endonuclease/exonuclease/phosphatase family protein [Sedimentisphaerales bacterium]|nr:endonuclease/exonuclease/phosphatase family protein [Sedimentisphaerales bacterium]